MNTEIFWTLFDNLALLSGLGLFAYWATGYDLSWWKKVNRMKWIANEFYGKFCLLEIKLPREITRSPQAMELVLDGLYLVAHTPPGKPVLKSYGNFFNKLLKIFTIKEDIF